MALMMMAAGARLVPMGNTKTWFRPEDYPATAIGARQEGTVRFALDVASDGKPTACRIVRGSGSAGLDKATCTALMSRAQFRPVVDRKGKPASGTFENSVNWHLPKKAGPEEISDRTFDARSVIAPTGEVAECTMTGSGGSRFGTGGNNCGPFGERGFLSTLMGPAYAQARLTHVRMEASFAGLPQPPAGRTPDFYQLLAESEITINADGSMGKCTSIKPLEMQGRTVNLCSIIAMAPPRFDPGVKAKKAVFVLDLTADYQAAAKP